MESRSLASHFALLRMVSQLCLRARSAVGMWLGPSALKNSCRAMQKEGGGTISYPSQANMAAHCHQHHSPHPTTTTIHTHTQHTSMSLAVSSQAKLLVVISKTRDSKKAPPSLFFSSAILPLMNSQVFWRPVRLSRSEANKNRTRRTTRVTIENMQLNTCICSGRN